MRLINTGTYKVKEFKDSDVFGEELPFYAILSHTWGADEVNFEDIESGNFMRKKGFRKLKGFCKTAQSNGFTWAWMDTCCTIQTHHRRQYPTKRVAYAAENGGRMYIAFQYKRINISILMQPESGPPLCTSSG